MAFPSFDLRRHANLPDVLLQFGFGLLDIDLEKLADVANLPGHELADAPDLGGNRIRLKLPTGGAAQFGAGATVKGCDSGYIRDPRAYG